MSRLVVREAFRNEMIAFAAGYAPPFAFYDTIDKTHKVNDPTWATVEFFTEYTDRLCYGGQKQQEVGTVDVTVFTKAGAGDTEAVTIGDAIQDYFLTVNMADVEVNDTTAASEYTAGDVGGKYYGITISIEYNYFY